MVLGSEAKICLLPYGHNDTTSYALSTIKPLQKKISSESKVHQIIGMNWKTNGKKKLKATNKQTPTNVKYGAS